MVLVPVACVPFVPVAWDPVGCGALVPVALVPFVPVDLVPLAGFVPSVPVALVPVAWDPVGCGPLDVVRSVWRVAPVLVVFGRPVPGLTEWCSFEPLHSELVVVGLPTRKGVI